MSDLIGERTALEQTRTIVAGIPAKNLPTAMYKKLVRTVYDQQLKKYTKLNRAERHIRCKELTKKPNRGETEVAKSPALLSQRALAMVLNEKPGETKAGKGSTQ